MKNLNLTMVALCCMLWISTAYAQVTVYQHYNYGGNSQSLEEGMHMFPPSIGNDAISSVKVAKGWKVTLYEHDQNRGRKLELTEDTPDLGKFDFNDITSNFKVERMKNDVTTASRGAIAESTFDPNKCYRLTTQWQGDSKSLDVINDGKNDKLQLANSGKYSGQYWKLTPTGKGYYRLTTMFQGEGKSLDVINDGKNNQLQLAKTGNYTGQYWKFTPVGDGYYRVTSQWQGDDKSLDVLNDGKNNQLQLAKTGAYTGQYWKLTEMDCTANAPSTTATNTKTALPDKFKVHAFSVNQGKGKQPDYWFGMTNNDSRGRILNDAQISSNGKLMEIETVSLGNNQYAFKVKNTGSDMYLTARDNKEVHVEKSSNGSVPEGAKFISVEPLTAAPGANEKNYRSFQSVKFKDHYLRHTGYAMFVHPSNGTELFKQDASWLIQKM